MIYILKNKIILTILVSILFSGCGYKQTNTQSRDIGFLKFNKSMEKSYKIVVNKKYEFLLDSCLPTQNENQCSDNITNKLYEITSGNVIIEVFENNTLIMKNELYLGSSNTKEINLP